MYLRGDSACFQTDKRGREPLFRSLWAVRVAAPSTPSKSRSQPAYPGLRTEGTPSLHTQAQRLEFRRRAWPVDSCHPVSRSLDGPVAQPRRQFRIALGPLPHTPPPPVFRPTHEHGPYRIALDVPRNGQKVRIRQNGKRREPPLVHRPGARCLPVGMPVLGMKRLPTPFLRPFDRVRGPFSDPTLGRQESRLSGSPDSF